ncbi:MAG: hypothetical protein L0207_01395 [Chlamydiae bacterium]|nr:hypothetical protein [Chlamydiota bacterium]
MDSKRCAVVSCLGLGDGLLALVLSHNLATNGFEVVTFHPFLNQLQPWFPHLPIHFFPYEKEEEKFLPVFDYFFFIYDKKMDKWIKKCLEIHPDKTYVLNPIATYNQDYPFWNHGCFDGRLSFVENIEIFCRKKLNLKKTTKSNGIIIPEQISPFRHEKRIVIHPTSSRETKNWSKEKFLKLSHLLNKEGFETAFILQDKERGEFPGVFAPQFSNLSEIAAFVAESKVMIGNDSGIGHLASCLGLFTMTICRHWKIAEFWKPSWSYGEVVTPPTWLPNLKGLRLRDKHWQKFISVERVWHILQLNFLRCFPLENRHHKSGPKRSDNFF